MIKALILAMFVLVAGGAVVACEAAPPGCYQQYDD